MPVLDEWSSFLVQEQEGCEVKTSFSVLGVGR